MTSAFHRFFSPPVFATIEQTQRARIFHRVVLGTAAELRPAILDQLGLFAALRHECAQLAQRAGIDCRVVGPTVEPKLSPDLATACYRKAQEALTNVVRHAGASVVTIDIQTSTDKIVLEIRDNGRGIAPNAAKDIDAHGLLGMREGLAIKAATSASNRPWAAVRSSAPSFHYSPCRGKNEPLLDRR